MIPLTDDTLQTGVQTADLPSRTWRLDLEQNQLSGMTDGLDAVTQAVFLALHTDRYRHVIYSWQYGVELDDLFGQPKDYVCAELRRRITEALTQDGRIQAVRDFTFTTSGRKIGVSFTVNTIYGPVLAERTVNI